MFQTGMTSMEGETESGETLSSTNPTKDYVRL